MFTGHRAIVTLLLVVAALNSGCRQKPPTHEVTGTVRYRGRPVTLGAVFFVPVEGEPTRRSISLLDDSGRYRVRVAVGRHRVGVTGVVEGKQPPPWTGQVEGPLPGTIPPRFGRPEESGIAVDVPARKAEIDIEFGQ